ECDEALPTDAPTFTDNCDDDLTITESEVTNPLACQEEMVRTWTATDDCGNATTVTQTITVTDTTAPTLTGVPSNASYQCEDDVPTAPAVIANDNCDVDPLITYTTSIDFDGCELTIARIWTVSDDCGNTTGYTQLITVEDTVAPEVESTPADATIECDEAIHGGSPTFTDNCDDNLAVTMTETESEDECPYLITRTWTATDNCGNEKSTTQIITVNDLEAPFVAFSPADATIECDESIPGGAATFTDNCDDDLTITFEEVESVNGCPLVITRTWTATDNCGNVTSTTQTVTINDTEVPVVAISPADATIECDEAIPGGAPTFTDNCDDDLSIIMTETEPEGECPFIITRTWTATDNCGNVTSTTQTVTVNDSEAPVVAFSPADASIECEEAIPGGQATFTDNCDDDLTITFGEVESGNGCPLVITRTWTAADNCGNETSTTQTITINDTVSPTVASSPADATIECDEAIPGGTPIFNDNCDNDLTMTFGEIESGNGCPIVITRTWTATDDCGNAVSTTQTITINDTVAPVVAFSPADETIECDDTIPSGAATFTDNCDDDLTVTMTETDSGDACSLIITRTWTATDNCGNATSTTQTITINDTVAPIVISSPANATIECDDAIPGGEAEFIDSCDDDLTITFGEVESGDGCPLVITRTWTATDDCGNTTSTTQVITINDTTAPILTLDPADVSIECDGDLPADEAMFSDNCDDDLTYSFNEVTSSTSCPIIITRTWTATDDCGNMESATQVITIDDTIVPVVTFTPADVNLDCSDDLPSTAATFADACDDTLDVDANDETTTVDCLTIIVRTWTATDNCNNSVSTSQTITVTDYIDPSISAPADANVYCGDAYLDPTITGTATATDNCGAPMVTYSDDPVTGSCPMVIVRTWLATDDCGNTSTADQLITITDEVAPVLTIPANITVSCEDSTEPSVAGSANAIDGCDDDVTVTFSDGPISGSCPYTFTRTWMATDNCGNTATAIQFITLVDNTAPELIDVPGDVTIECGEAEPEIPSIIAIDNCDMDVNVVFEQMQSGTDCSYTITRTWSATDDCGNVTVETQVISVFTMSIEPIALVTVAPNPFNVDAVFCFSTQVNGFVSFEVFDTMGKKIETLFQGRAEANVIYKFTATSPKWNSGMYFARLNHKDGYATAKVVKID
ncbi:MAG: hypothetical protein ACI81Y_002279, partial [Glaciecola sp.]